MDFFVPYSQNSTFTPRDTVAQEIDMLLAQRAVDRQIRIAIHGLGGAGYGLVITRSDCANCVVERPKLL